jgi:TP901 family phage tail tape measure protein
MDNDVNTNVVLTADNSQYDQAFMASAGKTDQLASSIDTITAKLDRLSKTSGRKLLGVAAVDIGSITAATAAYAAYENQLTSLATQAAVLNRAQQQQQNTMRNYRTDVDQLRRTFGMATSDAAALEQTVTRMADNTTPISKLTKTFGMMGSATGESVSQLSSSMLQLQKTMGTPQRDAEKYANQMTVLSKRVNTTATSLASFAQSIAPVSRLANISQTDLMGFSAAFAKAGQDGYQAANVFTKMLSDISYASQTGSPELNKYANLVGMTVDNFKQLGGTDQFLKIFEAINRQGPQAITTLNRMGLDGARTVRTVSAMAQSGGLATEINAARNADPDAMKRGSETSMETIVHELKRFRSEVAQTAESIGEVWAGPAKIFLRSLTMIAGGIREVVDSPLGKIITVVAGAAAPFIALAGALFLSAKALAAFSSAAFLLRGAPMLGFRDARAGVVSSQGANAMQGSWTNRLFYGGGARVGGLIGRGDSGLVGRAAGYGLYGMGGASRLLGHAVYGPGSTFIPGVRGTGGFDDVNRRFNVFNANRVSDSFRGAGPFLSAIRGGLVEHGITAFGGGFRTQGGGAMSYDDAYRMNQRVDQLGRSRLGGISTNTQRAAQAMREVEQTSAAARAMGEVERNSMNLSKGLGGLGRGVGNLTGMMASAAMSVGRTAGSFTGKAMTGLGLNPYLAGAIGLFAGYEGLKSLNNDAQLNIRDTSGFTNQYAQAGGLSPIPTAQLRTQNAAKAGALTLAQARNISAGDVASTRSQGFKLTNTDLKGLSKEQAQARLAQDWPYIMSNPAAVNAVGLDLTSLYGRSGAQSIMNNLNAGKTADLSSFASQAAHPGTKGFMGKLFNQQSGSKAGDALSQLFGGISDRTNYLGMTQGSLAASRYQGNAFQKAIADFTGAKGFNQKDSVISGQFSAGLLNEMFGTKLGTGDTQTMWLNKNSNLRGFLEQAITAPGGALRGADLKTALGEYKLPTDLKGNKAVDALVNAILNPSKDTEDMASDINSAANRIERMSSAIFGTGGVLGLSSVANALTKGSADVNAQYKASQDVAAQLTGSGGLGQQQLRINRLMSAAGGDPAAGADIFSGAAQLMNRNLGFQMPYMNRTQQFKAQFANVRAAEQTPISAGFTREQQMAQEDFFAQQVNAQYDYFKQMLYQQREFNVARSRAETDYGLQRQYSYSDFARSRERAETDFHIQRMRAEADFTRSLKRNRADYNLSRSRQEEDFHHSVMLMVEQQAKQLYNVYERVNVARTSSSSWLLVNAQDQLKRMQQQSENLNAVRKMGLSDNAIQQMGFTDPTTPSS